MIIHYLPNSRKIYMPSVVIGQPSGGGEGRHAWMGVCVVGVVVY